jgi:hypothetical protein
MMPAARGALAEVPVCEDVLMKNNGLINAFHENV